MSRWTKKAKKTDKRSLKSKLREYERLVGNVRASFDVIQELRLKLANAEIESRQLARKMESDRKSLDEIVSICHRPSDRRDGIDFRLGAEFTIDRREFAYQASHQGDSMPWMAFGDLAHRTAWKIADLVEKRLNDEFKSAFMPSAAKAST